MKARKSTRTSGYSHEINTMIEFEISLLRFVFYDVEFSSEKINDQGKVENLVYHEWNIRFNDERSYFTCSGRNT
jgi:hypothetical protein